MSVPVNVPATARRSSGLGHRGRGIVGLLPVLHLLLLLLRLLLLRLGLASAVLLPRLLRLLLCGLLLLGLRADRIRAGVGKHWAGQHQPKGNSQNGSDLLHRLTNVALVAGLYQASSI